MDECSSPRQRKKASLSNRPVDKAACSSGVSSVERGGQNSKQLPRRKWSSSSSSNKPMRSFLRCISCYDCFRRNGAHQTLRLRLVTMIVLIAVLPLLLYWLRAFSSAIATYSRIPPAGDPISVYFDYLLTEQYHRSSASNFKSPFSNRLEPLKRILKPDYGGLVLESLRMLPETEFHRNISRQDGQAYQNERRNLLYAIDDPDMSQTLYSFEDMDFDPHGCIPPKWQYSSHPNCNAFHELSLERPLERPEQQFHVQYLASGHYRESYLFEPLQQNQPKNKSTIATPVIASKKFVLKHLHYSDLFDFSQSDMQKAHQEALVMELLSGSPRTSNIYGFCSTSTIVERGREITYDIVPIFDWQEKGGRISQRQLDRLEKEDVHPMNNFTAHEKLTIALTMAEALAEMHGHSGGVIVHDDIRVNQWLIVDDGRLVLNDMNSAVVLNWNFEKKSYCKYKKHYGGRCRAPETYSSRILRDESADIWTMGNLIFCLLTGLWPYYAQTDSETIQRTTRKGIPPYLNPKYQSRSTMEGRLVELMNRCHKLRPRDRVDIFEVVRYLRETLRIHEEDVSAEEFK